MQEKGMHRAKDSNETARTRVRKVHAPSGTVAARQAGRVSARIDRGLLAAAARKVGSANTTEVVQAALAAFVAPDPFVAWFLSGEDRLPDDFELGL